jgi:hypothetical protein
MEGQRIAGNSEQQGSARTTEGCSKAEGEQQEGHGAAALMGTAAPEGGGSTAQLRKKSSESDGAMCMAGSVPVASASNIAERGATVGVLVVDTEAVAFAALDAQTLAGALERSLSILVSLAVSLRKISRRLPFCIVITCDLWDVRWMCLRQIVLLPARVARSVVLVLQTPTCMSNSTDAAPTLRFFRSGVGSSSYHRSCGQHSFVSAGG